MLTNFDNIVFDLGGVVIDLDRDRCIRSLENLGISRAGELLGLYVQAGPFLELETGRITAAEFFDLLRAEAAQAPSDMDLQTAFNAFLVRLPRTRLEAIRELRRMGKRTFCLSNTNPVMWNSWIAEHFRAEGLTVNDYFDGIIASFAEGCCKPDPEIFRRLVSRYQLDPSRTLFLDDSETNVEAARACGLCAERVAPGTEFTDLLNL